MELSLQSESSVDRVAQIGGDDKHNVDEIHPPGVE